MYQVLQGLVGFHVQRHQEHSEARGAANIVYHLPLLKCMCHCCRSLTYDSRCLPSVAELVKLTHLRLSFHDPRPPGLQLNSLHNLKELSFTNMGTLQTALEVSNAAELTKLEISGYVVRLLEPQSLHT